MGHGHWLWEANVTKGCTGDLKHRRTQERVEEDGESGVWELKTNTMSSETVCHPRCV